MSRPLGVPESVPEGERSPLRPYLVAAAGAVGAAILVASQTYLSMLHHGHSWWRLLLWQLLAWSFWAALAPSIAAAGVRIQSRAARPARWVPVHLVAALLLTAAHQLLSAGLTSRLQPFLPIERMNLLRALEYLSVPWAFVDLLVYWLLIAVGFGAAGARRRRQLELRESRLEAELARAQLQALRLELQPHFLFNTLNSIAALVRKRSHDQALEMVLGLSHLLRMTLDRSDRPFVPLHDEVAFVRRYVELQRQRFADRLAVSYQVDPATESLEVPTLLLQPLVENAIRYAVADRPEGGTIAISARREGDELHLRIVDDGPGPPAGFRLEDQAGVGLGSTRSRLDQIYGSRARLRLIRGVSGGATAEIVLPASPGAAVLERASTAGARPRRAAAR